MDYTYTHEDLKAFVALRNGFTVRQGKPLPKTKKLYSLLYKGQKLNGYINQPYALIKWKMNDMIDKGQAQKHFLEIRATKEIKADPASPK